MLHAGGLAVAYFLLKAGTWVTAVDGGANVPGGSRGTVEIVNEVFYWALLFAVILSAGMLVLRIVDFAQRWRRQGRGNGTSVAAKEGN